MGMDSRLTPNIKAPNTVAVNPAGDLKDAGGQNTGETGARVA
jgi:hypothetical protein